MIRKLWLISKFIMPQTGQEIIAIHILPNISRQPDTEIWSVNRI